MLNLRLHRSDLPGAEVVEITVPPSDVEQKIVVQIPADRPDWKHQPNVRHARIGFTAERHIQIDRVPICQREPAANPS